jgi:beta-lactamase regulating signal transducer with metallopeptidase domain
MMAQLLPFLSLTIETAVLLAVFWLLAQAASPRLRVVICRCAFAAALAAPVAFFASASKIEVFTLTSPGSAAAAPLLGMAFETPSGGGAQAAFGVGLLALAMLWAFGALFVASRQAYSLFQLSRAFEAGERPSPVLRARLRALSQRFAPRLKAELRVSDRIQAPCIFGWRRPKILIPTTMKADCPNSVLAHELCHARAWDAGWLQLGRLACAAYWFNPLIWACDRQHRRAIEFVCDDEAADGDVDAYAEALILAARRLSRPALSAAAVTMSGDNVAQRVRALLNRERPMRSPTLLARLATYAASLAAIAIIGATQLVAAQERSPLEQMREAAPTRGYGLLYIRTPADVHVAAESGSFSCGDNGSCVFEEALDSSVVLVVSARGGRVFAWEGCVASEDGRRCTVRITDTPARVRVRRIG